MMRLRSILFALLLAWPIHAAAQEALDLKKLTTMSSAYVAESLFLSLVMTLDQAEDKTDALAQVAALAPNVRTIFWLSYFQRAAPSQSPHSFFTKLAEENRIWDSVDQSMAGQPDRGDGLDLMRAQSIRTNPAQHADAVSEAFVAIGLPERAQIFAAMRDLAAIDPFSDFSVLDTGFGSHGDLRRSIDAFVDARPALQKWSARARAALEDEDKLHWLMAQLYAMDDAEIAALPLPLKRIFVVELFNAEMLNGGVHQFFFNSSGQYAPDVVEAFTALGLTKHADAVQQGMDMFRQPYVTDTQTRREQDSRADWTDWDDDLANLTDLVDDGEIRPAIIAYAQTEGLMPR